LSLKRRRGFCLSLKRRRAIRRLAFAARGVGRRRQPRSTRELLGVEPQAPNVSLGCKAGDRLSIRLTNRSFGHIRSLTDCSFENPEIVS
jgi:hypothetical protein